MACLDCDSPYHRRCTPKSAPTVTKRRKPFEVNPWFNYYVGRDGRNSALHEALFVGREQMTEPGPDCPECGKVTWWRPLVSAYRCYDCNPGKFR